MAEPDPRLAAFRAELVRAGLSPAQVAEIDDHLHCSIDRRVEAAVPIDLATQQALAALGDVRSLALEFHKESRMHPLSKLCGTVFALCAVYVAACLEGMHPEIFVSRFSIVPLLMIAGVTLGGLIASFGLRPVLRLVAVAIAGAAPLAGEAERLQAVCRRGQRLVWTGAALMLVTGTMHVLSVLEQPSQIGPGLAVCFVGLVYAALLAELGFGSAERWITTQPA